MKSPLSIWNATSNRNDYWYKSGPDDNADIQETIITLDSNNSICLDSTIGMIIRISNIDRFSYDTDKPLVFLPYVTLTRYYDEIYKSQIT